MDMGMDNSLALSATSTPTGLPVGLSGLRTRAAMEKAANEFEEVFMGQMLKPMWEGLETDPVFGGGTGEDVMRDMLIQEHGKSIAASSNWGIAEAVLSEMIRLQEQATGQGGTA